MKRSTKVIIFIIVLLVVIGAFATYLLSQYNEYTLTIMEINGDNIMAKGPIALKYTFNADDEVVKNVNGEEIDATKLKVGDMVIVDSYAYCISTVTKIDNNGITIDVPNYFGFSVGNAKIKDVNGNNITVSNLVEGNIIEVISKKDNPIRKPDVAYYPNYIPNVKQIKVIKEENNMLTSIRGVVMEVYENSLSVMGIEAGNEPGTLYSVSFAEDGNIGFKQGQEVLIYFDGMILTTYPEQIHNVGKIEIVSEQSEVEIPDDVTRYYNNTQDKVDVNVTDLTTEGVTITITDTNELPYEYTNDYKLEKEVKNEEYTGQGQYIGEATDNSVPGYTGTGLEYIWEEMNKNPDVNIEDTIEDLVFNLPNMTEYEHYTVIGKKIYWTNLYGELTDGKYRLTFSGKGSFPILIEFSVNNGEAKMISKELVM